LVVSFLLLTVITVSIVGVWQMRAWGLYLAIVLLALIVIMTHYTTDIASATRYDIFLTILENPNQISSLALLGVSSLFALVTMAYAHRLRGAGTFTIYTSGAGLIVGTLLVIFAMGISTGTVFEVLEFAGQQVRGATEPRVKDYSLGFTLMYGLILGPLWYRIVRHGRRLMATAKPDKKRSTPVDGPPVLYLRSFDEDGECARLATSRRKLRIRNWYKSVEELIADALNNCGPFIAIGKPQEELSQLGAARIYYDDASWQRAVSELAPHAQLVVVLVGQANARLADADGGVPLSKGLLWEVQQLSKIVKPENLILCVPERRTIDVDYAAFRINTVGLFPRGLPSALEKNTRFIYFDEEWEPRQLRVAKTGGFEANRGVEHLPERQREALRGLYNTFMEVRSPLWSQLIAGTLRFSLLLLVPVFVIVLLENLLGSDRTKYIVQSLYFIIFIYAYWVGLFGFVFRKGVMTVGRRIIGWVKPSSAYEPVS
jgi:hypothetical protein